MPAVEFQNIDIIFGKEQAKALTMVDAGATRDQILAETGAVLGAAGVSLGVERGEICVLMGLSGSGKSTIMRAVNRLNTVARGAVLVEHGGKTVDVVSCDDATLRDLRMHTVSMVFQQFALLPWRTVRENVGFGLELRGVGSAERKRIVDEKLALVGLTNWADKHAHELSGGMQQRVGLARAFATDAEILLMDEPFSALDPLIRDKLQDELLDLQSKLKKTILFVSHDLDEALKLGNKIAILEGGRIVQCGTGEDILLRPANDYVAEFVKHMNPLNVLRGTSVMTPAASLVREEGGAVLVDRDGRIRIAVDAEDRPISVSLDGRAGTIAHCDPEGSVTDAVRAAEVLIAPVDLSLKSAIVLKQETAHPILLVDQLGRLAGLCGDEEIYRGLLRRGKS
jgi:glycine betaine/proline transport system ATP-binding protein